MTQYLVTWTGVTSGTAGGRDDGYPETKMALIPEDRLIEFGGKYKVQFYSVERVDVSKIVDKQQQTKAREARNKFLAKEAALAKLTPAERKLLKV